jgi:hypothetical protein
MHSSGQSIAGISWSAICSFAFRFAIVAAVMVGMAVTMPQAAWATACIAGHNTVAIPCTFGNGALSLNNATGPNGADLAGSGEGHHTLVNFPTDPVLGPGIEIEADPTSSFPAYSASHDGTNGVATSTITFAVSTVSSAPAIQTISLTLLNPMVTGTGTISWSLDGHTETFPSTSVVSVALPTSVNSSTNMLSITLSEGASGDASITGIDVNFSGPLASPLVAAVLPSSRSVEVGATATAFATIINSGATAGTACTIAPATTVPATFVYQTTNPATNALIGTANTPVNIAAGASQSFVIALTPTAAFNATNVDFSFACANAAAAPMQTGLNTLLLSASTSPVSDIVALVATAQNDGILHIAGTSGSNAFAVATINLGASSAITATANTGGATLPLALTLCQTNPTTGQCTSPVGSSVSTTINANATPTFAIFGTANGAIPFDPANNRIFVQFTDGSGVVRGETSVAVETQ